MEALIEIENLSRQYGDLCAVKAISMQLHSGEVLGFLGPNGAGKSTTMRMICGALAPSTGSIKLCGIDLIEQPNQAKLNLGYLPETPPLYPDLTVDEYLIYSGQLRQLSKKQSNLACERVKLQCGLEERGQQQIGTLSKGYQQRLGIAQAIIHDPKIIVLDEPTSGLDPNQIHEIQQLIRKLAEQRGVLISTHILPEVQTVCDRVLILHRGELIYSQQIDRVSTSNTVQVELEHTPSLEQIEKLPGVASASVDKEGSASLFDITLTAQNSTAQLARSLVEQGWGLTALKSKQNSLEQTFYQLTQGDIS